MNIEDFSATHKEHIVKEYRALTESLVYFICEKDGEIIYIGSTANPQSRFKSHQTQIEFYNKPTFFITIPMSKCIALERRLIEEIKPKYNLQWIANYYGRKKEQKNHKKSDIIKTKIIKTKIIKIMADKGISQSDLGKKLKVSRQRVHQIIHDKNPLSKETIDKLEKALKVKLYG